MNRLIASVIVSSILFFISCDRQNELVERYPNGTIKSIWYFQKDTLDGRKEIFWENGNRNFVMNYQNGEPNGEFIAYYENGCIARRGQFRNGKLHGVHQKYFSSPCGKIEQEEYIMNPEGRHYYFYIKSFNVNGDLISYKRFLIIELDRYVRKEAVFKYVGEDSYDSMEIVAGDFTEGFAVKPNSEIDTFTFVNGLVAVPLAKLGIDSNGFIRGKFLGMKVIAQKGDSMRLSTWTQYYEQKFDDLNDVNTEIKISNDSTHMSFLNN